MSTVNAKALVEVENFQAVIDVLRARGYQPVGPVFRGGGIVYDMLTSVRDLPIGLTDRQEAGRYRIETRTDKALFGYNLGQHSWKQFLHPPRARVLHLIKAEGRYQTLADPEAIPRWAFIGVRPCDLHAIAIHDRVLRQVEHIDPVYPSRREAAFVVAVNCTQAGGTCFCASMGSGPQVSSGFDLALTEVLTADRHFFLVEIGTDRGADVLRDIACREASTDEAQAGEQRIAQATAKMGRSLDTANLQELLYQRTEHPHWEQVAERCLACGNCTLVCPTCFCTTVTDTTDLTGDRAERWLTWDSCFSLEFSYIHGGPLRTSAKARYRQWLTHKFATWIEQFGTLGCVGCGRCITWCPAGIDVTEGIRLLREEEE